jgi:hypothetical protein
MLGGHLVVEERRGVARVPGLAEPPEVLVARQLEVDPRLGGGVLRDVRDVHVHELGKVVALVLLLRRPRGGLALEAARGALRQLRLSVGVALEAGGEALAAAVVRSGLGDFPEDVRDPHSAGGDFPPGGGLGRAVGGRLGRSDRRGSARGHQLE